MNKKISWHTVRRDILMLIERDFYLPKFIKPLAKEVVVNIYNTIPNIVGNMELIFRRTSSLTYKEKDKMKQDLIAGKIKLFKKTFKS